MKNRVQSETGVSDMAELTDTELQTVSGGLNPQPLPPRVAFSNQFTNVAFHAFRGAIAWG
jgi:bacteriocin-like protein